MWLVAIGVLMIVLNLVGIGPTAQWTWQIGLENGAITGDLWKFLLPFVLALAWWAWSDATGLTRRREMNRDEERKAERRRRNVAALGLGTKKTGPDGSRRR
jgi:small Trp-rich protein